MKDPIETLQLKMYEYKRVLEHHTMIMLTAPNSDSDSCKGENRELSIGYQYVNESTSALNTRFYKLYL